MTEHNLAILTQLLGILFQSILKLTFLGMYIVCIVLYVLPLKRVWTFSLPSTYIQLSTHNFLINFWWSIFTFMNLIFHEIKFVFPKKTKKKFLGQIWTCCFSTLKLNRLPMFCDVYYTYIISSIYIFWKLDGKQVPKYVLTALLWLIKNWSILRNHLSQARYQSHSLSLRLGMTQHANFTAFPRSSFQGLKYPAENSWLPLCTQHSPIENSWNTRQKVCRA